MAKVGTGFYGMNLFSKKKSCRIREEEEEVDSLRDSWNNLKRDKNTGGSFRGDFLDFLFPLRIGRIVVVAMVFLGWKQ